MQAATENLRISPKHFQHYLKNYAETEAKVAEQLSFQQSFQHVLIIPVYDENPKFLDNFLSLASKHSALLVLVINQPIDKSHCLNNVELWKNIHSKHDLIQQQNNLSYFSKPNSCSLLVIDKFTDDNKIDTKQGVGLARKIASDVAVSLIANGNINSHWIHSSDADAHLPQDYFQQTQNLTTASAAVYGFNHEGPDSKITAATQLYQQSLHYYVNGLRWAKSPYAFHTIGSCLAINSTHYCEARGFPKRAGGEDFYLLNKLAKLGEVITLDGDPITLEARISNRVPFGTGPAVRKILDLNEVNEFNSYNPQVFAELKNLLKALSDWWDIKESWEDDEHWFKLLSPLTQKACQALSVQELFRHLRKQCKTKKDAQSHIIQWFDGFRTLKFIHWLQSNGLPALPLQEALLQAEELFQDKVPYK